MGWGFSKDSILLLNESALALATGGFACWCMSGRRGLAERILATAAVGAWARLIIERAGLPLLWSARPLAPAVLLAAFCFWSRTVPEVSAGCSAFSFLRFKRWDAGLRWVLSILILLGAVRTWRNLSRGPFEMRQPPLGRMRIRQDPEGRQWLALYRIREVAGEGCCDSGTT